MKFMKKNDAVKTVRKISKTLKNALLADDGESLYSKYMKGEINWSVYKNEIAKNKGHKNHNEYQKYLIEEKKKKELNKNEIKEKEELKKLYIDEGMSIQKISKIYGCHRDTIINKLKKYNISIRLRGSFLLLNNDGESLSSKLTKGEISPIEYFNECAKIKGHKNYSEYQKYLIVEKRKNNISPKNCMWTKEELEDLYAYDKQNLSSIQIGKIHDPQVSHVTILRWIDEFGIEKKTYSEATSGEHSHLWQGGITDNQYCEKYTSKVREYERERWYRRCVLCNRTEEKEGQRMSVHHVDYNKNQGCDSTEWKLIPLCISCNSKVNGNRNYYEHLFTNIIKIRKILEEFDYKIDYKSIGMIDEIKCKKIDKFKYKIKTIYNDFKYDWRSLGI